MLLSSIFLITKTNVYNLANNNNNILICLQGVMCYARLWCSFSRPPVFKTFTGFTALDSNPFDSCILWEVLRHSMQPCHLADTSIVLMLFVFKLLAGQFWWLEERNFSRIKHHNLKKIRCNSYYIRWSTNTLLGNL